MTVGVDELILTCLSFAFLGRNGVGAEGESRNCTVGTGGFTVAALSPEPELVGFTTLPSLLPPTLRFSMIASSPSETCWSNCEATRDERWMVEARTLFGILRRFHASRRTKKRLSVPSEARVDDDKDEDRPPPMPATFLRSPGTGDWAETSASSSWNPVKSWRRLMGTDCIIGRRPTRLEPTRPGLRPTERVFALWISASVLAAADAERTWAPFLLALVSELLEEGTGLDAACETGSAPRCLKSEDWP